MHLNNFYTLFPHPKPIIGMIHLAGEDPIERALQEMHIYADEGIDGALIENYHSSSSVQSVQDTLEIAAQRFSDTNLILGVNILPNEFQLALPMAARYGAGFVQLDYVAGAYERRGEIDIGAYEQVRRDFPKITVLGGVWPKYYAPRPGSVLRIDVAVGRSRADAMVVTGEGTGQETPLEKIREFKRILGEYPLVVGAGLTPQNVYEQLSVADAGIVGSALKPDGNTIAPVEKLLVRQFMDEVRRVRER